MHRIFFYFLFLCFTLFVWIANGQTCQCEGCPFDVPDETRIEIPYMVDGAEFNNLGTNNEICKVNVKFSHSYMGDMTIFLKSPFGDSIQLTGAVEQSGLTSGTTFDVSFVPCSVTPMPDPNKLEKWDNNQSWGAFGSYKGSYTPYDPVVCFENMTGSVNGTWTLIAEDHDHLYSGKILNFSIVFCNMSGIDCCTPDAGDLSQIDDVYTCIGESLVFDFPPVYSVAPPNHEYIYKYVVTENGFITGILDEPDLSSYGIGDYTVCGLSIFEGDTINLPATDGTVLLADVIATLSTLSPIFCGDFSMDCIDVHIFPEISVTTIQDTICEGDFYFFANENLTSNGIYYDTLASFYQCDSILELNLVVTPLDSTYLDQTTCFEIDAGLDTLFLKNTQNCDSTVFLNISYVEKDVIEFNQQTCFADSVGIDTVFLENRYHCDSLIITTTTLFPISIPSERIEYTCFENEVRMDTFYHTNQYGCDSLEIVHVNLAEGNTVILNQQTCFIDSVGTDTIVLKNQFDCDSLIITNTSLFPLSVPFEIYTTTCDELLAGRDTLVLNDQNGCDSLIITITTFTPPSDTTFIENETCNPDDVGINIEIFSDQNSCDSVVVTNTFFIPVDTIRFDSFDCNFNQLFVDTLFYKNQNGCDSLWQIRSFHPLLSSDFDYYTSSCNPLDTGIFYDTLTNAVGCDSFLTIHVAFNDVTINEIFQTVCEPHSPAIDTMILNGSLCDSIVITHFQYNPPVVVQIDKTSCDPQNIGMFSDTLFSKSGCDSIYLMTTTSLVSADTTYSEYETCNPLDEPIIEVIQREDCDSINISIPVLVFGDSLYVDSMVCDIITENPIIDTFRNEKGCLSWKFIELIPIPIDTTFVMDSTCNPNQAGTIIFRYERDGLCDSLVANTTILMPSYLIPVEKLTCNPLDTGIIFDTLHTNYGCDSILMIHKSLTEQIVLSNSYTSCNPLDTGHFEMVIPGEICDTIQILDVVYHPLDTVLFQKDTCLWSAVKDTFIHHLSFQGCDSITHVKINYLGLDSTFIHTFNCSQTDTFIDHFVRNNCDSVVITYSQYKAPSETFLYDSTCFVKDTGSFVVLEQDNYGCDSLVYMITTLIPPDTIFVSKESCNPRDTGVVITQIDGDDGCMDIQKTTTTYIEAWSYELEIHNISCNDANDGFISIVVPDDVTIQWEDQSNLSIRANLSAGDYPVTISGENCIIEDVFTIKNPSPLENTFQANEGNCQENGGIIQSLPSGATPPYTFNWSNNRTTSYIDSLPSGTYLLTITDDHDCMFIDSLTLNNKVLLLSLNKQSISCNGFEDGALELVFDAGVPPYQIEWSTGDTSTRIESLSVGNYSVVVKDANGCYASVSSLMQEPDNLSITFNKNFSTNSGNGEIQAFVTGGTTPYDYLWSTGSTAFNIMDVPKGVYTVTVTDKNGCILEDETSLTTSTINAVDNNLAITLYPNPTNDQFFIDFGEKIKSSIFIFSSNGNLVYSTRKSDSIVEIKGKKVLFNSGIYFVVIRTKYGDITQKIIFIND